MACVVAMWAQPDPEADAPVFRWLRREAQRHGTRGRITRLFGDAVYRAPVVVVISAALLLITPDTEAPSLQRLLGIGCAVIGCNMILVALAAAIHSRERGIDAYRVAGFHVQRTNERRRDIDNAVDPVLIVGALVLTLMFSFGVAYHGVSVADAGAFTADGKPESLSLIGGLFVSANVGGILGLGDIDAANDLSRLLATVQAVMTVVSIAFLIREYLPDSASRAD